MSYSSDPKYLQARQQAFARSNGWCQFCGRNRAEEAHHWQGYEAGKYAHPQSTKSDELIALCKPCHIIATRIRQTASSIEKNDSVLIKISRNKWEVIEEEIEKIDISPKSHHENTKKRNIVRIRR